MEILLNLIYMIVFIALWCVVTLLLGFLIAPIIRITRAPTEPEKIPDPNSYNAYYKAEEAYNENPHWWHYASMEKFAGISSSHHPMVYRWSWRTLLYFFTVSLPPISAFPATYYLLATTLNYRPPVIMAKERHALNEKVRSQLESLATEVNLHSASLRNIEELTAEELRNELSRTLNLLNTLHIEEETEKQIIADLHKSQLEEQKRAAAIKELADQVSTIQGSQLEAVTHLLTASAERESEVGFWRGVLVAFPIGLFTSLLAGWMLEKIKEKRQ